ncbi:unnamed protein product, partial [marine sediment metagenome]
GDTIIKEVKEAGTVSIRQRLIGKSFGPKKQTSKQYNNIILEQFIEIFAGIDRCRDYFNITDVKRIFIFKQGY